LRLLLSHPNHRGSANDNDVGAKTNKFDGDSTHTIDIATGDAVIDAQVAAFYPAQLRQLVPEDGETGRVSSTG
jgi:hypothetical protein